MKDFISGLELNRCFYHTEVKPILDKHFPKVNYSIGRIGFGSDVLGYDTFRSTDHDWGPRLELFLREEDYQSLNEEISKKLSEELPVEFMGFSTHFGDADEKGVRVLESTQEGFVKHRIEIYTIKLFFQNFLEEIHMKIYQKSIG